MPEFDFHASIKRLAEAEQECPRQVPGTVGSGYHDGPDDGCEFTGRIVPFASLRVPCVVGEHHDGYGEAWHGHRPDVHRGENCPGWVPEPDVEKACWRIHISHPYICYATTIEEELRGAEAWLEEKPCPCLSGCPDDCDKCCPRWPTKARTHDDDCEKCAGFDRQGEQVAIMEQALIRVLHGEASTCPTGHCLRLTRHILALLEVRYDYPI